jgi:hypothetical protein
MNSEVGIIWKETVGAYFKVLFQIFLERKKNAQITSVGIIASG